MAWGPYIVYVLIECEAENAEQARATVEVALRNEFGHGYEIQKVEE